MATAAIPPIIQKLKPDFILRDEGTFILLTPCSEAAREWVDQHIGQDNGFQPYFPTVVVEHRYIANIVTCIQNDGLAVQP
jgi:hypothetical protein